MKYYVASTGALVVAIVLAGVFVFLGMVPEMDQSIVRPRISHVIVGDEKIGVELVVTPSERARGLSGRDPLPVEEGMLFVFDQPVVSPFWMNKMRFNLDIIWILDDKVVDIWQDAPKPLVGENPASYTPKSEANFVLEVATGLVEKTGLEIGDRVKMVYDEK